MAVPKTTETRCRDGSVQARHVIQRLLVHTCALTIIIIYHHLRSRNANFHIVWIHCNKQPYIPNKGLCFFMFFIINYGNLYTHCVSSLLLGWPQSDGNDVSYTVIGCRMRYNLYTPHVYLEDVQCIQLCARAMWVYCVSPEALGQVYNKPAV